SRATIVPMRWALGLVLTVGWISVSGAALDARVQPVVSAFPGTVSIFAKNLDTGETYSLRGDNRVPTASTIKLAIMAATFAAVDEGKVKWTDLVTMHDADRVSGSGVIGSEFSDGVKLPLVDLVHVMIVLSDNTATNLVLDRISSDYVNQQMDKLGL